MTAVRVPASTSNLGAGFDCLGLALDLWLDASIIAGDGPPEYGGTLRDLDPERDIMHRTLRERGVLEGRRLVARSEIPIGKGLGSSAAAYVAALALAQLLDGNVIDRDRIFDEAASLEGHPDNVAPAVYGGLALDAERPTSLAVHDTLGIAIAVPRSEVSTRRARAILPVQLPREVAVDQASRAAALVLGLTTGNAALIRHGMQDRIAEPHRRGLIIGYEAAWAAGMAEGGYGVTISGAGSAVVAIAPKRAARRVAHAMAGAFTTAGNPAEPMTPEVVAGGFTVDGGGRE